MLLFATTAAPGFVVGGFDTGRGVVVSKVLHGSWAEQKGLKDRWGAGDGCLLWNQKAGGI